MIVKPFEMSKNLLSLKALDRRIPEMHPKKELITTNLAKSIAGYKGEKSLAYYLNYLSDKKYHIFHNVRLPDETHHFQMDILLLSNNYILILEVKNISGILFFDSDFKQLIRSQESIKEKFTDPVAQVERYRLQLIKWLRLNKYPEIPVESLVVSCNPRAILQTTPNNQKIFNKVLHSANLTSTILSLEHIYESEVIKNSKLNRLSNQILHDSTEKDSDILKNYNILQSEVLRGVHCPSCKILSMIRKMGKWLCPKCDYMSQNAHIEALNDYFLLFGQSITNRQARDFLNINSAAVTKNLLMTMSLKYKGEKKSRVYTLSVEE